MKKKVLSFALVIGLLTSLFVAVPMTANAETYDIYTYIIENGEVTITDCDKSVSRKIKLTKEDGRHVYMDTNNSSEDFVVNDKPVPRRDGAKIPAWNTWWNLDPNISNQ